MRTTLTLDDDVAARIEQLKQTLQKPLRDVVNEALRRGLIGMDEPRRATAYRTRPVDLGRCRIPNVDEVAAALAAALAAAESESHR